MARMVSCIGIGAMLQKHQEASFTATLEYAVGYWLNFWTPYFKQLLHDFSVPTLASPFKLTAILRIRSLGSSMFEKQLHDS